MKKYLMTGIAAIAMCAAFTSCSKDVETVSQEQINQANAQKIVADYEAAFIKAFGQPAASQDWGFGINATRATRGECGQCYKYDMQYNTPSFPKTGHPAAITDNEREYVKWWFENNPGLSEVGLDIHDFYLQHVWGQSNKPYNVIKKEDQSVEVNNATMDYCEVGDGTNYTHILDFNANGPGSYGIVYMRNSSALSFGFHATWGDNRDYHNFKLAHIVADYNGEHIDGWYVGLAMWGEKWDNGTKQLNADYKDYADDWILKVVPGDGEIIPTGDGRIIAEDLTAEESSDFDFNDVVFDYKYTSTGVDIVLRAAGGTLPLRLAGNDAYEVHKLFGVETNVMVNTGLVSKDPVSFPITGTFDSTKNGDDILVEVNKGTKENPNWIPLTAVKGRVASKVRVDTDYNWCAEREDIDDKYCATHNHFSEYVNGQHDWNTWYKQD